MRSCILLPIEDSVDNGIAFKVFEDVEHYLKRSEWCYYRSNSEILNILSNYKKSLNSVLSDKNVLRVVSEKTKTGSLIKVDIKSHVKGINVKMIVIADNGEDIYFREEANLDNDDYLLISQTIKNWLDIYEKSIPYDGRVIGVLGNQFTLDIGTDSGVFQEMEVFVVRPYRKKKHPLLKEVVDWETIKIGNGKILFSNKNQSQGQITSYATKKRLKVEDWVLFKKKNKENYVEKAKFKEEDGYEFGKIGNISLWFNIGKGSATSNIYNLRKVGGTIFGVDLDGQVWATRNYWAGLKISRRVGTLSKEEGPLVNETNSATISKFEAKVGYKYLPMGFFYGPQVDGYLGYSNFVYSLDKSSGDGFTELGFKGPMLGVKGSMPFKKVYRAFLEFNFVVSPKFTEEDDIYGNAESASNYGILVGGSYSYNPNMTLDLGYGIDSAKAKFLNPSRTIKVKTSTFKLGTTFTF
jgi:opacity protein-like surface antigen